jgi:hypothetical protein
MSIRLSSAYSMGKQKRGILFEIILILILEAPIIQNRDTIDVPGPGNYTPSYKTTKGKINP